MDSSSDASFAWTDASSDTIDSVSVVKAKMNKTHSEDESVSGKSYKRKLQEELFVQSKQEQGNAGQPGQTKRKWRSDQSESYEVPSPKKKKIKKEPESDNDASTNKNKGINHRECHDDSYDESYLNLKVKDEQHFAPPHPTKTKRIRDKSLSNSDILNESSESIYTKRKKKSKKHSLSDNPSEDNTLNELVQEESKYNERFMKKKKKKSKKRKESTLSDDAKPINSDVEGSYEAYSVLGTHSTSESEGRHVLPGAPGNDAEKNNNLKEEVPKVVTSPKTTQNSSINQYERDSGKRETRISERIQFEEESSDFETNQLKNTESSKKTDKLNKYVKQKLHLKPLKSMLENNEAALTIDDEIWLIRCPKDVYVDSFQDKNLTLEGKCKLKLSGQTYEGTIDHEAGNMSILSSEQSHFVIKSWLVKGFLNLRKRIPKTHIQDDIALNINQASFIPLPETKSRHPLFGYKYKKSLKLATSVTERLNTSTPSQYKKNKTQEKKSINCEEDHYLMSRAKEECRTSIANGNISGAELPEPKQASSRKKNKHKKKRDQDAVPMTQKKYKHDLESVEAWDSEKAIEENLFNF